MNPTAQNGGTGRGGEARAGAWPGPAPSAPSAPAAAPAFFRRRRPRRRRRRFSTVPSVPHGGPPIMSLAKDHPTTRCNRCLGLTNAPRRRKRTYGSLSTRFSVVSQPLPSCCFARNISFFKNNQNETGLLNSPKPQSGRRYSLCVHFSYAYVTCAYRTHFPMTYAFKHKSMYGFIIYAWMHSRG